MPVHEALAAYRGSVVICRALQSAGCGRNLVRQADVAGAAKQGPAPFPFGSASLCCGRRPRSPARSSSFLPPSWSGHHQRASGTSAEICHERKMNPRSASQRLGIIEFMPKLVRSSGSCSCKKKRLLCSLCGRGDTQRWRLSILVSPAEAHKGWQVCLNGQYASLRRDEVDPTGQGVTVALALWAMH